MECSPLSPFLTYDQLIEKTETWASTAPELVRVFSIATTTAGRDLLCVEIGDRRAGLPFERRPAFLVTANLHAVELAGSSVCVHLVDHLISRHPHDAEIRGLLQHRVLYVIPRVAIDGTDYVLATLNRVRSVPPRRQVPNRIYAEDIDGDGRILSMRVPDRRGNLKMSPQDPRLLVPKGEDDTQGPFYRLLVEGTVHDWDGDSYSDVAGDIDFNRCFPANWQITAGTVSSGPYPLSEPETRGVAEFVSAHPNICGALDFHTGNPAVFYPAAAVEGHSAPAEDAALIARLGQMASTATGFALLSSYEEITSDHPSPGPPGTLIDWLYEHRGVPAFLVELGLCYNYLGIDIAKLKDPVARREEETGLALLAWHDAHEGSMLFRDWRPFDHPQLGPVEIGGWDYVLWSNPPPGELEDLGGRCTDLVLRHLSQLPALALEATSLSLGSGLHKVSLSMRNVGAVPTYGTRRALHVHPAPQLMVVVEANEPMEFVIGSPRMQVGHLAPHQEQRLEWVLRCEGETTLRVSTFSERGLYAWCDVGLDDSR